jgi:hypothetical protein
LSDMDREPFHSKPIQITPSKSPLASLNDHHLMNRDRANEHSYDYLHTVDSAILRPASPPHKWSSRRRNDDRFLLAGDNVSSLAFHQAISAPASYRKEPTEGTSNEYALPSSEALPMTFRNDITTSNNPRNNSDISDLDLGSALVDEDCYLQLRSVPSAGGKSGRRSMAHQYQQDYSTDRAGAGASTDQPYVWPVAGSLSTSPLLRHRYHSESGATYNSGLNMSLSGLNTSLGLATPFAAFDDDNIWP